jgi:hypothetical protein
MTQPSERARTRAGGLTTLLQLHICHTLKAARADKVVRGVRGVCAKNIL